MCSGHTTIGVSASVTPKCLQERVDIGIGLEVGPGEEHQVLGQEVADAERVRRVARADDAQARERARLAHQLTAGHERPQDDVAEIRALVDDLLEERAGDGVDLAVASATAVKIAGVPVRCETSPVNSPRLWMAMVFGVSPVWSRISISPDRTTKNLKSRSPKWTSTSPAAYDESEAAVQLPS